ncbi:hypothetical protein SLEP1_g51241 [Rubroshorea leprosula]|uniref:Reverse transcriptase domain-containing protein n=1 Tax=Rubroshorea leprosula TaxID=152421 RepID=A0AAV5M3G8_9ROSI|nr:hypothetical protein SLEP1_g51241 [Rubroshorea leprosula]
MDGVVIANEVVDEAKRKKKKSFMLKIDFEKAYDKVSWNFLDYMMKRMGFCNTWRNWIRECLRISLVSAFVNGSLTRQFVVSRGLRQRDPLSPFLFLIITEGLNGLISAASQKGLLEGTEVGSRGMITSLDKIHRRFLWGRIEGGKKINWVNWGNVCKDKVRGGLGVKDLKKFNMALLGKWWERLMFEDRGLWKKVIYEKYGNEGELSYNWLREGINSSSRWWRDLCRLNVIDEEKRGWLAEGFKLNVGEGVAVKFWWDNWCGRGSLANQFSRLYLISVRKDNKISQMGKWTNDTWNWNLQWRRSLYNWEKQQETELHKQIQEVTIKRGKLDSWEWIHNKDGSYSTKSAYKALTMDNRMGQQESTLQKVWNPLIPNKIVAFTWQLLQDKISSKFNLLKRGVLKDLDECRCALCEIEIEDTSHLFIHCNLASTLWANYFKWWGISTALDKDCWRVFKQHPNLFRMTWETEGWECMWFTVIWTI